MVDIAFINIWKKRVGAVSWDNERKLATMEFGENFINERIDLSPIMMPLSELTRGVRIHSFQNLSIQAFKGLPGLLADSLPDRYGNNLIDEWLSLQGKSKVDFSVVERLCYIGKRGMGALEFEPATLGAEDKSVLIQIEELADIARQVLNKRKKLNTGFENNYKNAVREIIRVGTSAGGARAKAVIAVNDKTKKVRSGQAECLNSLIRTISNLFLSRLKLLEIIFDLEIHVIYLNFISLFILLLHRMTTRK